MISSCKFLLALVLVFSALRLSAVPVTTNFTGSLPYDYSVSVLPSYFTQFSNTTFSGSFTYDNSHVLTNTFSSNLTGVDNVLFHLQFSNGIYADFTHSLQFTPSWFSNNGQTYDLLSTGGPMYIYAGSYWGNFAASDVPLLNADGSDNGVAFQELYWILPQGSGNLSAGFAPTVATGQLDLSGVGFSVPRASVSPVPETGSSFALLAVGLLGLGAIRRRAR